MKNDNSKKYNLCIIGLGYVGLPLCIEFGKKFNTKGYDRSKQRIEKLNQKIDVNGEIKKTEFKSSKFLKL